VSRAGYDDGMRLPPALDGAVAPPLWPPLVATRGPGARSAPHAHHAIHVLLALDGELRVRRGGAARWATAPGVVTAPDVAHAIDASDGEVLLVFLDPESDAGQSLRALVPRGLRLVTAGERDALARDAEPAAIMGERGAAWCRRAVTLLGGDGTAARRAIHPGVRKLLRQLAALPPDADRSLDGLAAMVRLSPGRLMHVFTQSIGIPLRPYLAWLKIQRAAAAIAAGAPLTDAAIGAGFADGAHMTRTFRRMFGMSPSALRRSIGEASRSASASIDS
jgi:AraC-like DNA-binding protein